MIYLQTRASLDDIRKVYGERYSAEPFVRLDPGHTVPQLKHVVETNYCDLGAWYHQASECLVVISALDNLTKGAAGQAIQNLNVMMGWPETTGLL